MNNIQTTIIHNPIVYNDNALSSLTSSSIISVGSFHKRVKNIDALFHAPEQYRATEQGESYEALLARVEDFLKHEIFPLEEKMKRVLICCHGGIIRAFLAYIKGLEIKDFWNSHQPNCSVNILEVKNQKIRILEEHKIYCTLPEEKKGSIL